MTALALAWGALVLAFVSSTLPGRPGRPVGWRRRAPGLLAGVMASLVLEGAVANESTSLSDLALTRLDGQPVELARYRGRPLVLNLWATWCPPCRRELRVLEQAQRTYPDVLFVVVNQGEAAEQVRVFLEQERLDFKEPLLDPDFRAMNALGSVGLPTTAFLDQEGRLVHKHLGEVTSADLADKLASLFGRAPGRAAGTP